MPRLAFAFFFIFMSLSLALAEWAEDPLQNNALSTAAGEKYDVFAVSDDCGGMIVTWEDERAGQSDIYAQRIDVNGDVIWQLDGVPICTAAQDQSLYHSSTSTTGFTPILADGEGGAWIVWQDARFFSTRGRDIYLQQVSADGDPLFETDGLLVAGGAAFEDMPSLCSDGAGGVFVVWQDKNDDPIFYNIYGQHISDNGEALWNGGNSQALVLWDWDQSAPSICPDGVGGFYMAWQDGRDNLNDIYAQRFDNSGTPTWNPNHLPIAVHSNGSDAIVAIAADDGGAILSWVDRRSGEGDIYAQKLSADGSNAWTSGGLVVCNAANSQYRPSLCGDGASGAIVTWFDYRDASSGPPWDLNIYAQRILASGAADWTPNGNPVCVAADAQRNARLCSDEAGGAFISWEDNRGGAGHEDVYLQWIDGAGSPLLALNGQALSLAVNNQSRPVPMATPAGVMAAWPDDRDQIYDNDVYADRILLSETGVPAVNRVRFDFVTLSSRSFWVSNVGASTLSISQIELAESADAFFLEFELTPPFALAPGQRRQITVHYDPDAGGRVEDAILIHHDVADFASPLSVLLHGGGDPTQTPEQPEAAFTLGAYPNPFNPRTDIHYRLPQDAHVTLRVYSSEGRLIRELLSEVQNAGEHLSHWDGTNRQGQAQSSGQYHLVLQTKMHSESIGLILLR
jgi:hypothetical protein